MSIGNDRSARGAAAAGAPPADAGFRGDIEGLRGIAIALVLLYHAAVPLFRGGYVGVDVFFVLSGYLITGLIVRELSATGSVSLPAFYARRARRILPAAAVVLVVTVAVAAVVLPALLVVDVANDGLAAALYASNLRFAYQATDYLQSELAPSPLLHYWSLGVEEQFYLFWPALLLLVSRLRRGSLGPIRVAVALTLVISVAISIWLTEVAPPWAFFSLPSRAWELALGAALALAATRIQVMPNRLALGAGVVGLGLIGLAGMVLSTATPFPGYAALVPTLGTALVIAVGIASPRGTVPVLLSVAPLRWLGRISYSLYLWHWPVVVLPASALDTELPVAVRTLLVLGAIPLAAVTYRWVEEPIRRGRFVGFQARRGLIAAGASTVVVAAFMAGVGRFVIAQGWSEPGAASLGRDLGGELMLTPLTDEGPLSKIAGPPPATTSMPVAADLVPPLVLARDDLAPIYNDGCHQSFEGINTAGCVYGAPMSSTTIVLIGDSHAAQWFPTFERLAQLHGWRLVSLTKSGCAAADHPQWLLQLRRPYRECDWWRTNAVQRIRSERPALVVVSNSRNHRLVVDGRPVSTEVRPELWSAAVERFLELVRPLAEHTLLIGDTPRAMGDPPVCVSRHRDDALSCAQPSAKATRPAKIAADRVVAEEAGASFIDPTPLVCPSDPCPVVIGRLLVYRDDHHLTATFARALARFIEPALPPL